MFILGVPVVISLFHLFSLPLLPSRLRAMPVMDDRQGDLASRLPSAG